MWSYVHGIILAWWSVNFRNMLHYIINTVGCATTNECYNKQFLSIKIRRLQRTRSTIGRRSTRVRLTCRAFPLWLERQPSSLLLFVRFSYRFSSVICLFAPLAVKIFVKWFCYIILDTRRQKRVRKLINFDIKKKIFFFFFLVFTKERLFMFFKFICTVHKS